MNGLVVKLFDLDFLISEIVVYLLQEFNDWFWRLFIFGGLFLFQDIGELLGYDLYNVFSRIWGSWWRYVVFVDEFCVCFGKFFFEFRVFVEEQ